MPFASKLASRAKVRSLKSNTKTLHWKPRFAALLPYLSKYPPSAASKIKALSEGPPPMRARAKRIFYFAQLRAENLKNEAQNLRRSPETPKISNYGTSKMASER